MTTEIPQCDMIIMFVQSDKYNPKVLLKNRTVWARLKSKKVSDKKNYSSS